MLSVSIVLWMKPPVSEQVFARSLCADLKIILEKLRSVSLIWGPQFSCPPILCEFVPSWEYALRKGVLEQILRVEDEDWDYYKWVLEETEQNLVKKVSRKYSCSLFGWRRFTAIITIVCNLMEEHVREVHSRAAVHGDNREAVAGHVLDTHCRCDMVWRGEVL